MTYRLWSALGLMFFALSLASGCATTPQPIYDWGIYEQLLWEGYRADYGDPDPAEQLVRLEEDVQRIVGSGGRVPPGVHAHLGFLRYATGDLDAAREHFVQERDLFPESGVLIDGVLSRMEGSAALPVVPVGIPEPESSGEDGSPPDASGSEGAASVSEDVEVPSDLSGEASLDAEESD